MELMPRISAMANLWDRIAMKYVLNAFDEAEVTQVIEYRLRQAGYSSDTPLFTKGAIKLITRHTQGYPRKVSLICHNALESLVMHDKRVVDEDVIQGLIANEVRATLQAT
jgi:type II secretory pathway predicted ATPase ExeA